MFALPYTLFLAGFELPSEEYRSQRHRVEFGVSPKCSLMGRFISAGKRDKFQGAIHNSGIIHKPTSGKYKFRRAQVAEFFEIVLGVQKIAIPCFGATPNVRCVVWKESMGDFMANAEALPGLWPVRVHVHFYAAVPIWSQFGIRAEGWRQGTELDPKETSEHPKVQWKRIWLPKELHVSI